MCPFVPVPNTQFKQLWWERSSFIIITQGALWSIFNQKPRLQCTRSGTSKEICLPVPGYPTLSTNIMARIWNAVPGLQHASTLGAAKSLAKKWARDIPR